MVLGLVALQVFVLLGVSTTVYARSHSIAIKGLQHDLEVRARTLAGLLELEENGIEFEVNEKVSPEYYTPGEGVFAVIYNADRERVLTSQSLGDEPLPRRGTWVEDAVDHQELAEGPYGIPCAVATLYFVALTDVGDPDEADEWPGPTGDALHYQIRVAMDSRPRDAGLTGLIWFLVAANVIALLATLGGGLLLAGIVLRPVHLMTEEAAAMSPDHSGNCLQPSRVVKELRRLAQTLNGAFERLGNALTRQRRFAADASHELRTPIAVLLANSDRLLRRRRSTDEYVQGLALQRRVANKMRTIVDDLLTLARTDSGADPIRNEASVATDLVRDLIAEFEALADQSGIRFERAIAPDLVLGCDRDGMLRVLRNLLSNAVKFTPAGGQIGLRISADGAFAQLEVWDTGPGIPPEERERVFERFFRVHEGKNRSEGAGLGLAIAHSIVAAHRGSISIDDGPDGGTRFVIRLPRRSRERVRSTVA